VVHVQLADVDWLEVAVLAVVFLVNCIRVSVLDDSALVDCVASESARGGRHSIVSDLDFSWTTNRAYTCTGLLVYLSKSVLHLDLVDKELAPSYRS
jgi:hypothetical protein